MLILISRFRIDRFHLQHTHARNYTIMRGNGIYLFQLGL